MNLFGRGIHEFRIGAVGAGKINPRYSVNFVEAAREGEAYSLNEELVEFYGCDRDEIPEDEMLMRAKKLSDTAIVFLTRAAGENQDASTAKGEYYLSEAEEALIAKVTDTFAKTIVVLNVGYPIDVTFAEKYAVAGLIYSGFGGMLAGPALSDILSGAVNPSGKLPDTWAKDYFDIPSSKNFYDCVDKTRLTADEKDALLQKFHPDYNPDAFAEIKVGPNKGQKAPLELAEMLHSTSRLINEKIDLTKIDYAVDVLVIGGGGAGSSCAIEAHNAGADVMIVTKLRIGDANTMMAE